MADFTYVYKKRKGEGGKVSDKKGEVKRIELLDNNAGMRA